MKKELKKLQNIELENVNGGSSCTDGKTYSDDTYCQIGTTPAYEHGQNDRYHPLIVSMLNKCSLRNGGHDCGHCCYSKTAVSMVSLYCKARSKEHDPA